MFSGIVILLDVRILINMGVKIGSLLLQILVMLYIIIFYLI
nr:MAG TPA: hypothetical protein [Caudoviricetes sp.]